MRLFRVTKYVKAPTDVLDEPGISYKVEGPFPKRLSKSALPCSLNQSCVLPAPWKEIMNTGFPARR